MSTTTVTVYDPALCCPTGVCGPTLDQTLVRFAADLQWLSDQGVEVTRHNLAQEPMAFTSAPIKEALEAAGEEALPMLLINGRVVMSGAYATRDQLATWAKLDATSAAAAKAAEKAEEGTSSGCCGPKKAEPVEPAKGGCCGGK